MYVANYSDILAVFLLLMSLSSVLNQFFRVHYSCKTKEKKDKAKYMETI